MKKIIAFLLVILISFIGINIEVSAEDDLEPYSYIVIDIETNDILYEKNSSDIIYPASTTKILTAITALENTGIDSIMTVSKNAAGPMESGAVRLGVLEGQEIEFYELLHALLIKSANDVSVVIAENISGSVEEFSNLCNATAKRIGALNTHFVNPNGLHSDDHYTTAYDLAQIARYAKQNYIFSSIVQKTSYVIEKTDLHDGFYKFTSTNSILGTNKGYDFTITGIKTGYTSKAKSVLVTSAKYYDGREVICVVTGCPSKTIANNFTLELIKKSFLTYKSQLIVSNGDIVYDYLYDSITIPLAISSKINYYLPIDESKWKITTTTDIYEQTSGQINKGDILGEIHYYSNNEEIAKAFLVATKEYIDTSIVKSDTIKIINSDNSNKNSNNYILFIILSIWVILIVSIYIFLTRKKKGLKELDNE